MYMSIVFRLASALINHLQNSEYELALKTCKDIEAMITKEISKEGN